MNASPDTPSHAKTGTWQTPAILLMVMAASMQIAFAAWMLLTNNFAVEVLSFTGREIGIQQSVREIPGFLAFAAVFLLFLAREQTLAYLSLLMLGGAAAVTGYFPSFTGFLVTTFISSVGFHYYETMHQSLSLQWLPKKTAPATMGKILAVGSIAQLATIAFVFVAWFIIGMNFSNVFLVTGLITIAATFAMWVFFPAFKDGVPQKKQIVLKKRYWLYYALTFMGGARRQIFMVFAIFMMVERFGFEVHQVAMLAFANGLLNIFFAPMIGRWIVRFGERTMLTWEYVGLILVFTAYAFVPNWWAATLLYFIDHALFAVAIAMKASPRW